MTGTVVAPPCYCKPGPRRCDTLGEYCDRGPVTSSAASGVTRADGEGAGYTVRCVVCRQSVNHHQAHIVKTNHGSGRGWRCNPCGLIADEFIRAANGRQGF